MKRSENFYGGYRIRGKEPTKEGKKMSRGADISGQIFGRLTVIECLGLYGGGFRLWGCICECGKKVAVRSRELRNGNTKSCGCLNLEMIKERGGYNRKGFGVSAFNQLFFNYKKSARERDYPFELSESEFKILVESPCYYCGSHRQSKAPRAKGTNGDYYYTGVDRIINETGYTTKNSRPCCKQCNIAKGVLGEEEFYTWILQTFSCLQEREVLKQKK